MADMAKSPVNELNGYRIIGDKTAFFLMIPAGHH